jgi:hypothetical protein
VEIKLRETNTSVLNSQKFTWTKCIPKLHGAGELMIFEATRRNGAKNLDLCERY